MITDTSELVWEIDLETTKKLLRDMLGAIELAEARVICAVFSGK